MSYLTGQSSTNVVWMLSGCMERGGSLEQFEIDQFPFRVGRAQECEFTLASSHISAHHAEFTMGDTGLLLSDLGSTNGTFVNGIQLSGRCPVVAGDRLQFACCEFVLEKTQTNPDAVESLLATVVNKQFESHWIFSQFEQLMRNGLFAAYQPIVSKDGDMVYAFEALARSNVSGLERPDLMFSTAKQLHREVPLSHLCRNRALAEVARHAKSDQPLFLNTHPAEDLFHDVLASLTELRNHAPDQRISVEVHEGAVTSPQQIKAFAAALDSLGVELAYDDFGAGQTRLKELIEVPPNYIKFDASLISDLHEAPKPQIHMIRSLVETCQQVGAQTIAEGIERQETAEVCRELGFDLLQGYLFGPPTRESFSGHGMQY